MRNLVRYTLAYTVFALGIGTMGILHNTFLIGIAYTHSGAELAVTSTIPNHVVTTNIPDTVEGTYDMPVAEAYDATLGIHSKNKTCPFTDIRDGYIIDFTKQEIEFAQASVISSIDSFNGGDTHIPLGVYHVVSASYTPIDRYNVGMNSRGSSWYAELLALDGKAITQTNPTRYSMPNEFAKEIINEELVVSDDVYRVTVHHKKHPPGNSHNTIPLCLVFTKTE